MTTMAIADPTALVGFAVFDRDGVELGEVEGVYLGTDEPEWAAVLIEGRFVIIPLVDAEVYEDSVDIPFTADEVRGAPWQQDDLLEDLTEEQEAELVDYYTVGLASVSNGASSAGATGAVADAGVEVASTARDQGQEVASAAKEHGQQVASTAKEQGQRVASTAKEQGGEVVSTAKQQASEVVDSAKQQASEVAQQASAEARNLLEEARTRVEEQTAESTAKLGENLSRLGAEALALADGRPAEAPNVQRYVRQAGERLMDAAEQAYGISDDVKSRGMGGLLTDVQSFARRRPGVFLLGTAVLGVAAGRAVRNAKEEDGEEMAALPPATNGQRVRASTRGAR